MVPTLTPNSSTSYRNRYVRHIIITWIDAQARGSGQAYPHHHEHRSQPLDQKDSHVLITLGREYADRARRACAEKLRQLEPQAGCSSQARKHDARRAAAGEPAAVSANEEDEPPNPDTRCESRATSSIFGFGKIEGRARYSWPWQQVKVSPETAQTLKG